MDSLHTWIISDKESLIPIIFNCYEDLKSIAKSRDKKITHLTRTIFIPGNEKHLLDDLVLTDEPAKDDPGFPHIYLGKFEDFDVFEDKKNLYSGIRMLVIFGSDKLIPETLFGHIQLG